MNKHFLLGCTAILVCTSTAVAQQCVSPKYTAGSHHEKLGGGECLDRCTNGGMEITPRPIDACEGETISPNVFINGNSMSNHGDTTNNAGGVIDWNDGSTDNLTGCCQWHPTHSFALSSNYCVSATYGEQHNNAFDPAGGCSYRCRQSQTVVVIIHLKTSPECASGKYVKPKPKKVTQTKQSN